MSGLPNLTQRNTVTSVPMTDCTSHGLLLLQVMLLPKPRYPPAPSAARITAPKPLPRPVMSALQALSELRPPDAEALTVVTEPAQARVQQMFDMCITAAQALGCPPEALKQLEPGPIGERVRNMVHMPPLTTRQLSCMLQHLLQPAEGAAQPSQAVLLLLARMLYTLLAPGWANSLLSISTATPLGLCWLLEAVERECCGPALLGQLSSAGAAQVEQALDQIMAAARHAAQQQQDPQEPLYGSCLVSKAQLAPTADMRRSKAADGQRLAITLAQQRIGFIQFDDPADVDPPAAAAPQQGPLPGSPEALAQQAAGHSAHTINVLFSLPEQPSAADLDGAAQKLGLSNGATVAEAKQALDAIAAASLQRQPESIVLGLATVQHKEGQRARHRLQAQLHTQHFAQLLGQPPAPDINDAHALGQQLVYSVMVVSGSDSLWDAALALDRLHLSPASRQDLQVKITRQLLQLHLTAMRVSSHQPAARQLPAEVGPTGLVRWLMGLPHGQGFWHVLVMQEQLLELLRPLVEVSRAGGALAVVSTLLARSAEGQEVVDSSSHRELLLELLGTYELVSGLATAVWQ